MAIFRIAHRVFGARLGRSLRPNRDILYEIKKKKYGDVVSPDFSGRLYVLTNDSGATGVRSTGGGRHRKTIFHYNGKVHTRVLQEPIF